MNTSTRSTSASTTPTLASTTAGHTKTSKTPLSQQIKGLGRTQNSSMCPGLSALSQTEEHPNLTSGDGHRDVRIGLHAYFSDNDGDFFRSHPDTSDPSGAWPWVGVEAQSHMTADGGLRPGGRELFGGMAARSMPVGRFPDPPPVPDPRARQSHHEQGDPVRTIRLSPMTRSFS